MDAAKVTGVGTTQCQVVVPEVPQHTHSSGSLQAFIVSVNKAGIARMMNDEWERKKERKEERKNKHYLHRTFISTS